MDSSYFHDMYRVSDDPWGFTSRWYEQRKYGLTLAALSKPRYQNAFEAGCSIGVLTELLAHRCDRLLAVDLSEKAASIAAERLAPLAERVQVQTRDFVSDWPGGAYDLIVLSEVLYYLDDDQFESVLARAGDALTQDGELVCVHWRRRVPEYPSSGDRVHDRLAASDLVHVSGYTDHDFRLDVYRRTEGMSVAEAEGLV